jgi:hypothetical protein
MLLFVASLLPPHRPWLPPLLGVKRLALVEIIALADTEAGSWFMGVETGIEARNWRLEARKRMISA